jgi:LysR family hydrogen peroxide-inducible transcriptional activator
LGVAQPSLSEQIKQLEQILGGPLFDRLARGVALTPAGRALLPRAQALLEDAAALPKFLDSLREEVSGELTVGAIPTVMPYFLAPFLRQFVDAYPQVALQLREATTRELIEQVHNGVMDLAILSLPINRPGLVRSELFREPLYLAVPNGHALASETQLDLGKIDGERLLILKEGHCLRGETLALCQRVKAKFSSEFEADQFASIFSLIGSGFGLSIVPEMARQHAQGCQLIALKQKVNRRIGFVRLERHFVSKPMEAFIRFLRERAADQVSGAGQAPRV